MMTKEKYSSQEADNTSDFYLEHPPRMPKLEIAEYVESQGVPVPQRFKNLDEARKSGQPFIIRSEHPQDYNGASNILDSLVVSKRESERYISTTDHILKDRYRTYIAAEKAIKIKHDVLTQIAKLRQSEVENMLVETSEDSIWSLCFLLGIDVKNFKSQISFSYWEYVDGVNLKISADSTINNKVHVFSDYTDRLGNKPGYCNYHTVERGKFKDSVSQALKSDTPRDQFSSIFDFYDTIRNFSRFDRNCLPVIEAVQKGEDVMFLQYLRGRSFSPAEFDLKRKADKNEVKAKWVRGCTPEEGAVCKTKFWYSKSDMMMLTNEDASFDFHDNPVFTELMTPKRYAQFIAAADLMDLAAKISSSSHLGLSKLFKPHVSILLTRSQMDRLVPEMESAGNNPEFTANLKIVSDGRSAYVSRM